MAFDALLSEKIIWSGRPHVVTTPPLFRAAAAVCFVTAATATCFAVVTALALQASPAALLLFAAWMTTVGFACWHGPKLWYAKVQYVITEGHVVWRRGPFRRVINRRSISYARIFWHENNANVGDVELVRAVPTGALRRRLLLTLHGLAAPDKVWALVRDVGFQSESNAGERCISQRLEHGERVLWSARPRANWRRWLPQGKRSWQTVALALTLLVATAYALSRMGVLVSTLIDAGLAEHPAALAAFIVGEALVALLMISVSTFMLYSAIVQPARQLLRTRYLITNRRVLIQRENEELHLDRRQIVDVITVPASKGLKGLLDVFLVLDGPRARAFEVGGAFGESDRDTQLKPILESVLDVDSLSRILLDTRPSMPPESPEQHPLLHD